MFYVIFLFLLLVLRLLLYVSLYMYFFCIYLIQGRAHGDPSPSASLGRGDTLPAPFPVLSQCLLLHPGGEEAGGPQHTEPTSQGGGLRGRPTVSLRREEDPP